MALKVWAALVYWTGKVTGTLVAETVRAVPPRVRRRHEFTAGPSAGRWQWARSRSWNAACLAAVAHRICSETWPATVQAIRHQPQMSCYDTVCSDAWCVYACVYYVVAWLDRASEVCALVAAVTWRRRSTVQCLNSAAAGCVDAVVDRRSARPKASDVPWNAYLIVAFPVVQFAMAATEVSPSRDGVWHAAIATAAAVASCAPVVATGTAAALLTVANSSMRSINHRITRVRLAGHHRRLHGHPVAAGSAGRDDDDDDGRLQRIVIARLAHKHWKVTELVTDGVCGAFSVDLMLAVLLAAVRVTYVAISVFHCLTQDVSGADGDARAIVSLTAVTQLIAWFGQFAYLARTCDELTAQVRKLTFIPISGAIKGSVLGVRTLLP